MKVIALYICLTMFLVMQASCAHNIHRYMLANYNQFAGKKEIAYKWYQEIFKGEHPLFVYKGYAHLLFDMRQYKALLPLIAKVEPLTKKDPEFGLIFGLALENTGNIAAADTLFISLNDAFKHNQETTFYAVNAYVRRKEPENALRIIDTFLNASARKPNNFVFYFLKAQIYAKLNNLPQALSNIKSCLELQPAFDKGWLMLALLEENAGRLHEAIKGYHTFLEISGSNQEIEQHLLKLAFQQSKQQENPLLVSSNDLHKALAFVEKKEYPAALTAVKKFLETDPKSHEGRILTIEILAHLQKQREAIQLLTQWIVEEPHNAEWFKVLSLLPQSGSPYTDIIIALKELELRMPHNITRALYLADAYVRHKDFKQAVATLESAVLLTQDPVLKTKIFFQLGLIHYENGSFAAMQKALEQGYNLNTNFPPLLNLLAYYYGTKGENVGEAQKLISLALTQDKNNPHFLDTQALILYNQKKYPQALKVFQRLALAEPQDFTIHKHLGKTYYRMGKYKEAFKTITYAQKLASNNRERKSTEKILNTLKAYEK